MDILKNPIVIGISCGVLSYIYLLYQKNKDDRNNPNSVNLLIPLLITIIAWFISYSFFEHKSPRNIPSFSGSTLVESTYPTPIASFSHPMNYVGDVITSSTDPSSFTLSGGINPNKFTPSI